MVEGGGQCVDVNVGKVCGGWINRVRLERVLDMQVDSNRRNDLRLRKVIVWFCLGWGTGMSMTNVMARWSEMVRSVFRFCG